jgi:23S rRNA (pseudouridine1915-N3)-methyltransferase
MQLELLFLGKTKDSFLSDGIDQYLSRLKHYTQVAVKTLKMKSCSNPNDGRVKEQEGKLLLGNSSAGAFKVVLDPRGRQFTSEEVARLLGGWEQQGVKKVSFIIGGSLGLADDVVQAGDLVLSLSKMTFTHDMTRLFLLEQLYRAYTIKAGEKYHK